MDVGFFNHHWNSSIYYWHYSFTLSQFLTEQKLQCWASWKEAGYLFIVAAIDAEKPRYVMVGLPPLLSLPFKKFFFQHIISFFFTFSQNARQLNITYLVHETKSITCRTVVGLFSIFVFFVLLFFSISFYVCQNFHCFTKREIVALSDQCLRDTNLINLL